MSLEQFEQIVKERRSVRHFKKDPVPEELLKKILEVARWAPSNYNLQPTHFVVIQDQKLKEEIYPICYSQKQILDAPIVIAMIGSADIHIEQMPKVIQNELQFGSITPEYADFIRQEVLKSFEKMTVENEKVWLAKHVGLSAMLLMLAAQSAGIGTLPMEGFHEENLKKVLNVPKNNTIPMIIAVGYFDNFYTKPRLTMDELVHFNKW